MESARCKQQCYDLALLGWYHPPTTPHLHSDPTIQKSREPLYLHRCSFRLPFLCTSLMPCSLFHQVNSFFKTWSGISLCKQSLIRLSEVSHLCTSSVPRTCTITASQFLNNIIQKLFSNYWVYATNWLYNSKYDRCDSSAYKAYFVRWFFYLSFSTTISIF